MNLEIPGAGWSNGDISPQSSSSSSSSSTLLPSSQLQLSSQLYPHTIAGKERLYTQHRRWIGLNSSWSRIGEGETEFSRRTSSSSQSKSLGVVAPLSPRQLAQEASTVRALMAQLCEFFYHQGWATGTGGGISIRTGGPAQNRPWRVFVAPSGLQKEDLIGNDMFELDMDRNIVSAPTSNPNLRQSACTPLWYVIFNARPTATAVVHTHSPNAVYATLLDRTERSRCLRFTHFEMLKGVGNHAYDDVLELPIIDNRPTEDLLAEQLAAAVRDYPRANAVLVRRHGMYVWGDSWEQCKTIAESVDYLLACAVQLKQLGVDPAAPPPLGSSSYRQQQVEHKATTATARTRPQQDGTNDNSEPTPGNPHKKQKITAFTNATTPPVVVGSFHGQAAVDNAEDYRSNATPLLPRDNHIQALLLDVEGCTTSIAFVKNTLFPFIRTNLLQYLQQDLPTQQQAQLLQDLLAEEVQHLGESKNDSSGSKDEQDAATSTRTQIVACVTRLMDADIKSRTLKELQGDMWRSGYERGELQGHVYGDTRPMLEWMHAHHVPVYIYSSGSVAAQQLLFGHSVAGNLRPFLRGHFDIATAGNKKLALSYQAIADQLGLEPRAICFSSDAPDELVAAAAAGIGQVVMTIRPGNAPIAEKERFPAIHSLLQLCGE
jgi:methylthioribulose 1-phosphate dehydratase / enolase-phosphatase E1